MTILQSLDRYYDRMAARGEAEPPGFTVENISYAVLLGADGSVRGVHDLRVLSGKKPVPARMSVPRPKRTSNIQSNFLWDKSSYAFGVGHTSRRLQNEHESFKTLHRTMLAADTGPHAKALLAFIERWSPDDFDQPPFSADMIDTSFVFSLEGERQYLHQIPHLRAMWLASLEDDTAPLGLCLVTGEMAPIETGHPVIKGVRDAQSSGAYLVSHNAGAFTSYGKPENATNSPTSKTAALRYGAALNGMLERGSRNRLRHCIGDATVVFWADTSALVDETAAQAAENWFAALAEPPDDASEAKKLREQLADVLDGRPLEKLDAGLVAGTRFHILGLSPNAARLAIRYWLTDDFGAFATRLGEHYRDLAIEPPPWGDRMPSISRLLVQTTAMLEKFDTIPSMLAGEMARAVLEGTRYPHALLASALMRLRAGDDPSSGWHAAVIKAVLTRDHRLKTADSPANATSQSAKEGPPVSLDRENADPAYQLGRLFAAYETAQRLALGTVNATIRDRYFGAALATPSTVFPLLMRGVQNHLAKLRKSGKGIWLEREIEEIINRLDGTLPRALPLEAQGRFVIGYYHQRKGQVAGRESEQAAIEQDDGEAGENDHDA